jgi:hypothetical protein
VFAVFFLAGVAAPAHAQTYPSRPVTMVVPFPPGGNTDLMARALQTELAKALGQSVIISNKGGAAGTLGILDLVRADPDGYTMALTPNNPITAQPHLQQQPRYGMDTFRYVCLTYYAPYVLIAGPQAPFKTFDEFVRFAKAKSENLVYGHPGVAGQPHLVMLGVLKADRRRWPWACCFEAPARCRTRAARRHDHGDHRESGRCAGEQFADSRRDLRGAPGGTVGGADHEGAWLPGAGIQRGWAYRSGQDTRCGGGGAGKGLRHGGRRS